ncbi:peptide chain release factor N(5)-glutamine methyltransferase [bacterium]|nr:peptide chain release factor N(5)-glutamine methyltransferase [bacterium]
MSESRRLIDLLTATGEFFKSKGIESPRRNAEALFAKALNVPRIELYVQHDRPLRDPELSSLRELIRRRARREPLQYILGQVEFCGANISLFPGLLIPRPETEELVAELQKQIPQEATVLDIGCGSGCISVALAAGTKSATVTAVDVDADALRQTMANALNNGVAGNVSTIHADLFDERFSSICNGPFDVVVSNPPYVREDEWQALQPEVRDFERKPALVSGPTGLECYVRIAELLPTLLKTKGTLGLEFGFDQASRIRELFQPLLGSLTIHRDMQGKERFLIGNR